MAARVSAPLFGASLPPGSERCARQGPDSDDDRTPRESGEWTATGCVGSVQRRATGGRAVRHLRSRLAAGGNVSEFSNIEWTDATWNPVRGCEKVSPGCAHCYAETFAERFRGVAGHPYEQGFDVRLVPEKLEEPLHWKKPRRIFVNSMSDLFQDGVPDAFIDRVFAVMALCPQHTFQVL